MHRPDRSLLLIALLAGLLSCARAAAPTRTSAMPEFAFIFRPGGAVSPDVQPRRNAAARDWALALRREGVLRAASPFEDGGFVVTQQGVTAVAEPGAIASVLIIEAKDLEAAVALAKGHPGLAFGTQIEVRPVKPVPPAP